jgi:hypothetical protein
MSGVVCPGGVMWWRLLAVAIVAHATRPEPTAAGGSGRHRTATKSDAGDDAPIAMNSKVSDTVCSRMLVRSICGECGRASKWFA